MNINNDNSNDGEPASYKQHSMARRGYNWSGFKLEREHGYLAPNNWSELLTETLAVNE